MHARLVGDGANASSSKSEVVSAQKIEPLTVAELNQYVLAADPQVKLFQEKSFILCVSSNFTNILIGLRILSFCARPR